MKRKIAVLLAITLVLNLRLYAQKINTYAGGNFADNCPAMDATVSPRKIIKDNSGNLILTDHFKIRKINIASGVISTIAGNETALFSGDNGSAINATLLSPKGVCVDGTGNIYIIDDSRIRKISTSGIITTIAGSGTNGFGGDGQPAINAIFNNPKDITVDVTGNIYIADAGNSRIRKISSSTGLISTIAGNGASGFTGDNGLATSASIKSPSSVILDAAENIYIGDGENFRIRKINTSGIITTIAGNGTQASTGDNGLAINAELALPSDLAFDTSGRLYFSEYGIATGFQAPPLISKIRMINLSTGIITTLAGLNNIGFRGDGGAATSAMLYNPNGIVVDATGDIYISDTGSQRIRKISFSTGIINSITGWSNFGGDGGLPINASLAVPWGTVKDGTGNVYIADSRNQRIRKVSAATGQITTIAGNGTEGFSGDNGLAINASLDDPSWLTIHNNEIYFNCSPRIRKINLSTGIITTVAGSSTWGFSGDGGPAINAQISPQGIALDISGNLYIADYGNQRIRKVDQATGIISTIAGNGSVGFSGDMGPPTSASLNYPRDVAVDANGVVYIADTDNYKIRIISTQPPVPPQPEQVIIKTIAGNNTSSNSGDGGLASSAGLYPPSAISLDDNGNLYISCYQIRKITAQTGIISGIAGYGSGSDGGPALTASVNALDMMIDSKGVLFISGTDRIRKIQATANISFSNTTHTYNGTGKAVSVTTVPSGLTVSVTYNGSETLPVNAGTYSVQATVTGPDPDYFGQATTSLTINKTPLTATANASRAYGAANPAFPISYTGFVNAETASVIDTPPTTSTMAILTSNVGTYPITLSGGLDNNYTITPTPGTLSIIKASLQVTADNKSRSYGAANPTFTKSYSGFVNGETASVIDTSPTASTSATVTSNAGTYSIVPSGGVDNNYTFTYTNGTLTVNKASLQAIANNVSRSYGTLNPTFGISYSGFVNGEMASIIDTPPTVSTSATVTSNVGTYSIVPLGGLDNNYTFTYVNGTLTINKASLLVTADNKPRTYGAANPALTISYSGFANSETVSVIDTPPTVSTSAIVTSNAGTYPIIPSGGLDNNYTFTYANGTLTINKASLLATADNKSRSYGAANPAFTLSYSGFVNGETASVIDTPPTASTSASATSNVSTYSIIPSGGLDNNYTFTYANGTLTVSKVSLLATADNKSRPYGASNPTFTIFYTGFVNSETASVIDTPPTGSTSATSTSNAGTYPIVPSGGVDNNYTFTYANGTLTICAAGSIRQLGDLCTDGYVDLRAGGNPVSVSNVLWSTGETTQTIRVYDPGTFSVTYTSAAGCIETASILVQRIGSPCIYARIASPNHNATKGEEIIDSKEFTAHPNPANQTLTVELPVAVKKPTSLVLYDTFGKITHQSEFKAGEKTKTISTAEFANGIYMMQILTPQGTKVVRKVMIKH